MKTAFVTLLVIAVAFIIALAFRIIPHGDRPFFASWRQGKDSYAWRLNIVRDAFGHHIFVDLPHNTILPVNDPKQEIGFYTTDQRELTTVKLLRETASEIQIPHEYNMLFVVNEGDKLQKFPIPAGLGDCVLSSLEHPFGSTEHNIADSLMSCNLIFDDKAIGAIRRQNNPFPSHSAAPTAGAQNVGGR